MRSGVASPFKETETRLFLHLFPSHLSDLSHAIYERLNRYLLRFSEPLGGVPLSYSDINIEQDRVRILYDQPHLHFHVSAKFLLFCPVINGILVGTVNKVSVDHIGLLVYGVFNASIPTELMKPSMVFSDESATWTDTNTNEEIEVGTNLAFQVAAIENTNDMLTITGSVLGDDCHIITDAREELPTTKVPKSKTPLGGPAREPPRVSASSTSAPTTETKAKKRAIAEADDDEVAPSPKVKKVRDSSAVDSGRTETEQVPSAPNKPKQSKTNSSPSKKSTKEQKTTKKSKANGHAKEQVEEGEDQVEAVAVVSSTPTTPSSKPKKNKDISSTKASPTKSIAKQTEHQAGTPNSNGKSTKSKKRVLEQ